MSILAQKALVGLLGFALLASVIVAGRLDAQRRKRENPPPAQAAPPPTAPALKAGWDIYHQFSCVACHGADGQHGANNFNAQTGQKVPPVAFVAESYTREELIRKIQTGVPVVAKLNPNGPPPPLYMPAFKNLLTEAQMNDLINYLFSLEPKGQQLNF